MKILFLTCLVILYLSAFHHVKAREDEDDPTFNEEQEALEPEAYNDEARVDNEEALQHKDADQRIGKDPAPISRWRRSSRRRRGYGRRRRSYGK